MNENSTIKNLPKYGARKRKSVRRCIPDSWGSIDQCPSTFQSPELTVSQSS